MIRKLAWRYKPCDQSQGVNLTIRVEHIKFPEPAPEGTCTIELERKARDQTEKLRFFVTKKTFEALREGIGWMKDFALPSERSRTNEQPDIQYRCEDASGLVLMREIPSFQNVSDIKIEYKIGDGAGFEYAFESLDSLEAFMRKLQALLWTASHSPSS